MSAMRRRRGAFDIWPGFVDALTSLIMVMIFVLLIFAIGQFVLSDTLGSKNRALDALNARVAELAKTLSLTEEQRRTLDARAKELAASLGTASSERDAASSEAARLGADVAALAELNRQLEAEVASMAAQLDSSKQDLVKQTEMTSAESAKVELLNRQLAALNEQLGRIQAALDSANRNIDAKDAKIADLGRELNVALANRVGELERYRSEFFGKLRQALGERSDVKVVGDRFVVPTDILFESGSAELGAAAQVELLNRQLAALNEQLAKIQGALDIANKDIVAKDAKIADLGKELNIALANRVGELERYRSEFFGKLRAALGGRTDLRIVGDRFVLPTDILFESGSAELGADAQERLVALATSVSEVAAEIPSSIDWVLRIDGHTDRRPIHTAQFPSNWELSTARAVALVKYLVVQGIPAHRLSANGFGEFQPLDRADTPDAWSRNRRIEIQLTNR